MVHATLTTPTAPTAARIHGRRTQRVRPGASDVGMRGPSALGRKAYGLLADRVSRLVDDLRSLGDVLPGRCGRAGVPDAAAGLHPRAPPQDGGPPQEPATPLPIELASGAGTR
jgi:hypothetical protein